MPTPSPQPDPRPAPDPSGHDPTPTGAGALALTAEQRLLVLDAWRRSGLPAGDFAPLVGGPKHTLYAWKKKFGTQIALNLRVPPGARGTRAAGAGARQARDFGDV